MAKPRHSAVEIETQEPTDHSCTTGTSFKLKNQEITAGGISVFELSAPRMMYVQLSWSEHRNKNKQVFALSSVDQLLSLPIKPGQVVEAIDLLSIPSDPAEPLAIERVSSILAAKLGATCVTKYLVLTQKGDIFPMPLDKENSIERSDFELIYVGGNWIASE